MSAQAVRLLWERMEARDWEGVAAQLHPDVVVDWPNTAERMRGRENYVAVQREYPEDWHVEVLRIVDGGDQVASEVRVDHDGKQFYASSFFELADGKIVAGGRVLVAGRTGPGALVARRLDGAALSGLRFRHAQPADHARIVAVLDEWWGGRRMVDMLPKLFFTHFRETSFVAERDGELAGFLIGLLSQSEPEEAYVHFVGVTRPSAGPAWGASSTSASSPLPGPRGGRA